MPVVKVRGVIKMLKKDGWVLVVVKGSHRQFKHPRSPDELPLLAS